MFSLEPLQAARGLSPYLTRTRLLSRKADYSGAEGSSAWNGIGKERENSLMFVGICLAVMSLCAAPMIWVWAADRIKRRKNDPFRRCRDLESRKLQASGDPPRYERFGEYDSILSRKHASRTTKPSRAITADQILGVDKASYLQRIVPQSDGSSQLLTVAPAHFRSDKQRATTAREGEQYISPWDAEHSPNPVIFPWLSKKTLVEKDIVNDNCESLQVMTMTDVSKQSASPTEDATSASADEPSPGSSTEYTSSIPATDKSSESPDAIPMDQISSDTSHEIDPSVTSSSSDYNSALHKCDTCQTTYITLGQLNMHLNRKHRRRYKCEHCNSAFSLKADLKRHERSVHRDMYADKAFYCSNPACTIPQKKFIRRDNFERHVRRCLNRDSE